MNDAIFSLFDRDEKNKIKLWKEISQPNIISKCRSWLNFIKGRAKGM